MNRYRILFFIWAKYGIETIGLNKEWEIRNINRILFIIPYSGKIEIESIRSNKETRIRKINKILFHILYSGKKRE